MTRFILSLMMFTLILPRLAPAQDERGVRPSSGNSSKNAGLCSPIIRAANEVKDLADASENVIGGRLARLTAYWSCEGDYYTRHHLSSTGIRLHQGHCAVDPSVIPYGSVVQIAGLGNYLAVDTGTAVVSRRAAREAGHNRLERNALVIDLYFENRAEGEEFAANGPKYASISWSKPDGDAILGMSDSAVKEEAPIAAHKPVAKKDTDLSWTRTLAAMFANAKPAPKPAAHLADLKPVAKPEVKVAATRQETKSATFVASVKSVSKHDTPDTTATSWALNSKDEAKLWALKTTSTPATTVAAHQADKLADQADGSEHILMAQEDTSAHHKSLYQF